MPITPSNEVIKLSLPPDKEDKLSGYNSAIELTFIDKEGRVQRAITLYNSFDKWSEWPESYENNAGDLLQV